MDAEPPTQAAPAEPSLLAAPTLPWPGDADVSPMARMLGALFQGSGADVGQAPLATQIEAIRGRDPGFDETDFLSRAEWVHHQVQEAVTAGRPELSRPLMGDALWLQHRATIETARRQGHPPPTQIPATGATICAAHSDAAYDTLTLRFGTDLGVAEDWTFQRAAGTLTRAHAATAGHCPNCGAPLQMDDRGACAYCHEVVTGEAFEWVLVRIEQTDPAVLLGTIFGRLAATHAEAKAQRRRQDAVVVAGLPIGAWRVIAYALVLGTVLGLIFLRVGRS